jgi:hypothetical protein
MDSNKHVGKPCAKCGGNIIPLSKGGKHHPSNLQILTAYENLSKGDSL